MKKLFKASALLLFSTLIITGCGTSRIYNVPQHKVSHKTSSETVYKAIRSAGQSLGWNIQKVKPGVAQGKLNLRSHVAVVQIKYTNSSYSIRYVRSQNLKYNAKKQTIHGNYNGWIQNLEKAIDVRL